MILTLYPRGKDSVSLRWLQLAAHNHLPHSIIHHCGARMQRQQWKENPMEDLCWTVATSAQKQKTTRWKCLKSNLQKVSQLKSIEIPCNFHGIGCWDKRRFVRFVMEKNANGFFSGTFVQQILTSKDGRPMLQALPDFCRSFCEVGICRKKD